MSDSLSGETAKAKPSVDYDNRSTGQDSAWGRAAGGRVGRLGTRQLRAVDPVSGDGMAKRWASEMDIGRGERGCVGTDQGATSNRLDGSRLLGGWWIWAVWGKMVCCDCGPAARDGVGVQAGLVICE